MGTTNAVTVTGSATLILGANPLRQSFYLLNNGVNPVFVSEDTTVNTGTSFPLAAASQISEDRGMNIYKGDIYGITAGTSEEIRYWERTQY